MDPFNWEEGEFSPITGRDAAAIRQVIQSLEALESDAAMRLRDRQVRIPWRIADARRRLADERRLANGSLDLVPKRVMLESSWLPFSEHGTVMFRIYPYGDASAYAGGTTVFMWMARVPGISFNFNLQLRRGAGNENNDDHIAISTAPRLWQADMCHYRMDIAWSEVSALLSDLKAGEYLEFAINVLQWHPIRPPEEVVKHPLLNGEEENFDETLYLDKRDAPLALEYG
jgi:hypothetical protein